MSKKIGYVFSFLVVLAIAVAIPFSVRLVQERQELRKEAAVPGGTAILSLSGSNSADIDQVLPITINFQTPTTPGDKGITGIKVTLFYNFTTQDPLKLSESNIDTTLPSPWSYVRKTITTAGTTTTILIEAIYLQAGETGYLGAVTTAQPFATLNFTVSSLATVNLEFDSTKSEIRSKDQNLDILGLDSAGKSLSLGGGITTPTPTPTPTTGEGVGGAAPTSTPTPTPTPTTTGAGVGGVTPTPTPTATSVKVKITSISSGETIYTRRPTFSGTAAPGAKITITIESPAIQGTIYANSSGYWSWTPTEDLSEGQHTVSIAALDNQGNTSTTSATFTVSTEELPEAGIFTPTLFFFIVGGILLIISGSIFVLI